MTNNSISPPLMVALSGQMVKALSTDAAKCVIIYTDGAAEPNPGPAGYGVVSKYGQIRKERSGGFEASTNNRMELLATIVGLEALTKTCCVTLYSDSKYVVDSVNRGSVFNWRDNDWFITRSVRAKNVDLWDRFIAAYEKHKVTLVWVPGHAGIPENERCDQLAVEAAQAKSRSVDLGYADSQIRLGYADSHQEDRSGNLAVSDERRQGRTKHKKEGESCRKCGTFIKKRTPKTGKMWKHFEWYLYCPGCKTVYIVEEAKRRINQDGDEPFA